MIYLDIAGIHIHASGFDCEYFSHRTREYESNPASADLTVSVEICDYIPVPEFPVSVSYGYRRFCRTDDGYCIYDFYDNRCVAAVFADKNWENVNAYLVDIKDIGEADCDIRRFNLLGMAFRQRILRFNGIVYHSSTICYKDKGVIFTAASGTGKSTHTGLWTKYYNDAFILNDDSPVIRIIDNKILFCGTPWSGKTELNKNICVDGAAVVFLQRGENSIKPVTGINAFKMLFGGMMNLPVFEEEMELALSVLQKISDIPMYILYCDISKEAVDTVKNEIFK